MFPFFRLKFTTSVFFILTFASLVSSGQVVLNEICPTNISGILNSNGQYDDWIELYNAGSSPVNLNGYGLSDDSTALTKFIFQNYTLPSHGYVLVFASDSNASNIADHWETAVLASTTWKYFAGTSQPDTNWRNNSFNDASWSSGAGGIGFGDGDDATTIPVCKSVMMRKTFTIPDTSQILKAVLNMDYDDGFVAYLNGVEIARANIGVTGDRPRYDVLASVSHEARVYQGLSIDSFFVDPVLLRSILRQGSNVLAVEVHNVPANSNDLTSIPYLSFGMRSAGSTFSATPSWFHAPAHENFNAKFKMSRSGEKIFLTNASRTIIDSHAYPSFESDNSTGRSPNGTSTWCYFSTPTPGTSNNSSTCYSAYASIPLFSLNAGFYTSSQHVTLTTTTPGGVIRYTTNGNDPTASSTRYTTPILVNRTMTIRAKVFATNYLPSPTITNTYFYNVQSHLPIFTITTDSLNLWDYNTGIYVMGPNADANYPYKNANFWQDWRKPAAIEYYDKAKNRVFRFNAEISIFGNYSRAKPQKSMEISLSDRFGTGSINYALIPDKPFINNTNDIVLRNSGSDWNVTQFRDAYMERVLKGARTGYIGTEPAVMFLNGQYWGVFTIHENHDHHWIEYNYGFNQNEIDYFKEYGSTIEVKNGSDTAYWTMYNYATTQNANSTAYYNYMKSVWDLDNYTDYFIAETYYNNGDWIGPWTNNIKLWRSHNPDHKWRYLVYDLDFGLGYSGSVNDNRLSQAIAPAAFSYSSNIFAAFLGNNKFKQDFINRYADLINTIFLPSAMTPVMHSFQDSMSFDMPAHFAKWGSTMSTWQSNINVMTNFVNARPAIVRNQIQSQFNMAGQVTLTLNASPAGSGRIQISTITPTTLPWSGVYFNGNPVTLTAIPNPGYTFDHFRSAHTINSNNTNQSVTYNFTQADQITAYFTGSAVTPHVNISEINYHSDSLFDAGDWVELHNYGTQSIDISGWSFKDENDNHKFTFPVNTVIPANGYLVLAEDLVKFAAQHPGISNVTGPMGFNLSNAGEQIRLFDYRATLYLSINYQDQTPWPVQADGAGYTCELSTNTGDPNDGNNWFPGCIGGSPGRAFSSALNVPVTVSGNTTFCAGGSVNLNATSNSAYQYQWLKNGVNIPGATTPSLHVTTAGSYTVFVGYQGCSSLSDPTTVTIVTNGPAPTVTPASHCGPGSLTLTATSTDTIYWFDAPGGNLLGSGSTFVTPVLNSTTTYYAQTSLSCPSAPVAVRATINDFAVAPTVNDTSRCGPGSVTLMAVDTATIHWYTTTGALVATGSAFVTPAINTDTLFYAEAGNVCPSPRIEVLVRIRSTPPPTVTSASRCGSGTLDLTASSASPVFWYDAPNGGNYLGSGNVFTTPVLDTLTTYYAEADSSCPSIRVSADAIVNLIPDPPATSDTSICGPGSVILYATASEQVFWYDAPAGGNEISSGSYFTTPWDSVSSDYYVETGNICRSARVPVHVTVNPVPAQPVSQDVSRCGPGSIRLSASSPLTVYWYDDPQNGNALHRGSIFTTPSIQSSTTYYVVAMDICPSAPVAVQAIITPVSTVVAVDGVHCGPGRVTMNAISQDTIFWYNLGTSGTLLGTGSSYETRYLASSMIFQVIAGTVCPSQPVPVQAIVAPVPVVNLGPDTLFIQSGQMVVLSAGSGFNSYYWSTGSTTDTIITGLESIYRVKVVDTYGCVGLDSIYISVITGMKELEAAFSCSVYPVPVHEAATLVISSPRNEQAKIQLMDAMGRLIRTEEIFLPVGRTNKEMDMSGLARGVYFLHLGAHNFNRVVRLILE